MTDDEVRVRRRGRCRVGVVPNCALMPTGEFCATTFFFKQLCERPQTGLLTP